MAATPKKAVEEERTIVFVDEAGFCLLPMAVRTYAPCGHTPVLRVKLTHDHLSAIGGITPDGRLVMQSQDHARLVPTMWCASCACSCASFQASSWSSGMGHQSIGHKRSRMRLCRGAAKRIHLERLPGYAPELNPQEGVWNLLKRREREAMSVAVIWPTSLPNCDWPKNVCDIGARFSGSVSLTLAVLFSFLR